MVQISEMFTSIQGEGKYAGQPAYFIRFQGCNVHCPFCDTKQAQSELCGQQVEVDKVLHKAELEIVESNVTLLVITGGEPFQQRKELLEIIDPISRRFPYLTIQVETSGSVDPNHPAILKFFRSEVAEISLSPKAIKHMDRNWLRWATQLKLLVDDGGVILPENYSLQEAINDFHVGDGFVEKRLYFMPVVHGPITDYGSYKQNVVDAIDYAKRYNGFAGLQLHKYMKVR